MAEQSTYRAPASVGTSPCSSTIRPASMRRTRPSRTTSSICRTARSSYALSIVPRYIVAGHDGSMRNIRPESSSRAKRSSTSAARAPASASSEMPSMIEPTCSSGWNAARSLNQASRGRTHVIRSGSTSLSSSQTHASTAVFPAPSTT